MNLNQPGIFIPHTGTFVSAQHLLKRSMICMAEDSKYTRTKANFLSTGAILSQQRSWEPSAEFEDEVEDIIVGLWDSSCCCDYKQVGGSYVDNSDGTSSWVESSTAAALAVSAIETDAEKNRANLLSLIHEALGGMKGDKAMLRFLRDNPDKYNSMPAVAGYDKPMGIDSLDIWCDQHGNGGVAYLFGRNCPAQGRPNLRTKQAPYLMRTLVLFLSYKVMSLLLNNWFSFLLFTRKLWSRREARVACMVCSWLPR